MATEKNLNNLIINKVENQAVYDYMKINNLINADELYFISGADDNATETESGLMSAEDKIKLDGIQEGAEINQNAFSNVTIGSTTISADSKTDTLTLVAGSNVTITPDSTNDKITIAATDTTYNAAGSSLGLVKSGGDVNISNGIITVNDNSHSHTIDNVDNLQSVLNGKVNAVDGKGLSTNDLTNTLKSNYDAAYTHSQQTHAPANAEKNVIVGIQKNGTDLSVNSSTRKVNITIPTKTSDLTNDSNFATTTALDTKVDKITGKSLSTNDYTTQEKTKLSNIEDGANKTVVDTALSSTSTNPVQNKVINTKFNTIQSNIDNKVPSSRTVNGKALSSNISLVASDVGAIPTTDGAVGTSNLAANAVTNAKIADGAVTNGKLASDSVGTQKLIDGAVSASKISYGALVAIKEFSIENSVWIENSYGTYNKTVTIDGIDPAKHIGFLMLRRSVKIPDVDTSWEFSSSMLDTDDEKMSCIFGSKITAVNELTITAKEKPIGTIYLTLMVVHI